MEIKKTKENRAYGIKITAEEEGKEIGNAFLYVMYNQFHKEPFALIEYIFVEEAYRGKGVGNKMLEALIEEAKVQGCYKLLATSRFTRPQVHEWYERKGFVKHGVEFRMDLV